MENLINFNVPRRGLPGAALFTVLAMALSGPALQAQQVVSGDGNSVEVQLDPLGSFDGDMTIGGAGHDFGVLKINVPLVRRVVLKPEDVRDASITLSCRPAPRRMDVIARGTAHGGDKLAAADVAELSSFAANAGEAIAVVAWKTSWHYNGGISVPGFSVVKTDPSGKRTRVTLPPPDQWKGAQAETPIGTFAFAGIFNRDKMAAVSGRVVEYAGQIPAIPGAKPASWSIPDASGVGISLAGGTLKFHNNGRAKFGKEFDSAPALVFTPSATAVYAFEGTLEFSAARPEDEVAWMVARLREPGALLRDVEISLHRVLKSAGPEGWVAGRDYDSVPIASQRIGNPKGERVTFQGGIAPALRHWLDGTWKDNGVLVAVKSKDGGADTVVVGAVVKGTATVVSHPKVIVFDHSVKPRPDVYVVEKDGHLYYGGQRLRLWGMVKDGTGERIRGLGFNCVRAWFQKAFYDDASAKRGEAMQAVPGDGSSLDEYDRFMADLKAHGIFVMLATTVGPGMPLKPLLENDSWLAGGEDWDAWKAAVTEAGENACGRLAYADDRLWKIRLRHAENVFNHRNPYTGKRYAEEEIIALVEINNEAGLLRNWLEGGMDKWPDYFRNNFQKRWNQWLRDRYPTDAALTRAWQSLPAEERLSEGTVKLAPMLADRSRYSRERQEDFLRFLTGEIDRRNQEYRTVCRALAPKGIGINTVPFSFDSQYRPSIPWLFTNWMGDTSTVSMYFWKNGSMLLEPPSLYVLDGNRLQDKLSVIYETGRGRPSIYRAEYPYILAAMTSWQDFDVVVWHGNWFGKETPEQLLAGKLTPPSASHYWNAVHLEKDPVMSSAVAMAGRLFLNFAIPTAPDPAQYTVGSKALYSFDAWNGIGGTTMSRATFERGSRIKIEPENPVGVLLDGKPVPETGPAESALQSGDGVLWDWQNGRLVIDTPTAKAYVGRTDASYRFRDGLTLSGFTTPFIAFSIASADGKPLCGENATRLALVNAVFDARNTGFEYDYSVGGGPVEQAKAVKDIGSAPIVVDPVGYTLSFPDAFDASLNALDFAHRVTRTDVVKDQNTLRQKGQTDWMTQIVWTKRGKPASPVVDPSRVAASSQTVVALDAEKSDPRLAPLYNPLPGLSWGDNFERAFHILRDGAYMRTSVKAEDTQTKGGKRIAILETPLFLDMPADVDVLFADERMREVAVTFRQSPTLSDVIADYEKRFGKPEQKQLTADAFAESTVRWVLRKPQGTVNLFVSETQGVVRIRWTLAEP